MTKTQAKRVAARISAATIQTGVRFLRAGLLDDWAEGYAEQGKGDGRVDAELKRALIERVRAADDPPK